MSNAIPFEDWLDKQGDDVFLAMCDGHPSTIILVDKTDFAVYRYTNDKAENAKLRELVVRMYKSIRWSDMTSDSMFSVAHSYEKDMRDLGIEVPR